MTFVAMDKPNSMSIPSSSRTIELYFGHAICKKEINRGNHIQLGDLLGFQQLVHEVKV